MRLPQSRMSVLLVLAWGIAGASTCVNLAAQDRFAQFQQNVEKRWDEIRPRGRLLQQLRENLGVEDRDDESARRGGQPTPADPRTEPADRRNANRRDRTSTGRSEDSPNSEFSANSAWPRSSGRGADRGEQRGRGGRSNRASENSRRDPASNERMQLPAPPKASPAPHNGIAGRKQGVELGVIVDERRSTEEGLRVAKVTRDSVADKAGLRSGDILASIAGVPLKDVALLDELLTAFSPEDQVQIEYVRGGKSRTAMIGFGGEVLRPQEFSSELSSEFPTDAMTAPLPPDPSTFDDASSEAGARSVLRDSRRSARLKRNSSTEVEQPHVYPSNSALPPVTGSSVHPRGENSILRRPDTAPAQESESLEIELLSPDGK